MGPQGGANPLCVAPGEGVWWQVTREGGGAGSLFLGLQAVSLAEAPVGRQVAGLSSVPSAPCPGPPMLWTGWPALSPLSGVKLPFPGDLLPPIMHFGSDDNPPTAHGNSALPSVRSVVVSLGERAGIPWCEQHGSHGPGSTPQCPDTTNGSSPRLNMDEGRRGLDGGRAWKLNTCL